MLIVVGTTVLVEMLQLRVISGRDSSLGDILMNTVGGAVGIVLCDARHRLLHPEPRTAAWLALAAAMVWCALVAFGGWAVRPEIPSRQYHSLLAPDLVDIELFEGRIIAAAVDGRPVVNGGSIEGSAVFAARVREKGVRVDATITPGPPTFDIAPIVALGVSDQPLAIELGQNARDAVFRVQLRSASLRLRVPAVALRNAFPASAIDDDTARIAGSMTDERFLRVAMSSRLASAREELELTPFLGWWLFMPFDVRRMSIVGGMSALWVAALLFPLGYWSRAALRSEARASRIALVSILIVAACGIGLVALPRAFGYSMPAMSVWLAAVVGLAVGALAAATIRSAAITSPVQTGSSASAEAGS
jgi:hypothetical protein